VEGRQRDEQCAGRHSSETVTAEPKCTAPQLRPGPMNPFLSFLLSDIFPGALHPEHLADLQKSGPKDETIGCGKLPFAVSRGWLVDHTRMKIFLPLEGKRGHGRAHQRKLGVLKPMSCPDVITKGEYFWEER